MDEKDWVILKTLSEERTISKTAQHLYISQPALTYRIKQIENEFGVKIVSRNKKGVLLTTEGEYIVNYARNMLVNLREIKDNVLNLEGVQGTLRLGVSSIFAYYKLPSLLKVFTEQFPEIQINVTTGWSFDIMHLLQKEEIQIGIVRGNHNWNDKKHQISEESIFLVSSSEIDLKQLPNLPRIDYITSIPLKENIDNWWRNNYNQSPNIKMVVDRVETCKEMIKHGLGYGLLPEICLKPSDELFTKKISFNNSLLHRETWLFYRDSLLNLTMAEAFINFLCTATINK